MNKYLSFSQLGRMGNLGNQIFQISSILGIAKKYEREPIFPQWKYSKYFVKPIPQTAQPLSFLSLVEENYHYTPRYWDKLFSSHEKKPNLDVNGWLQSEKYWEHCKEDVLSYFEWEPIFKESVLSKYSTILENGKENICISVRRGDYIGNSNYEQLPITYYILALEEYFPKWREYYNIFVFSDDISYCKHHLVRENIYFAEGLDGIEQLCLMSSIGTHYIIANSTFSWWGAYLGQKEYSKIIRPNYLFDGDLLKKNSSKDFYPSNFEVFDHKNPDKSLKKIDLKDTTFTIPYAIDSKDRANNLGVVLAYLDKWVDTNIIAGEGDGIYSPLILAPYKKMVFKEPTKKFHRTKMLNEMANEAQTNIIVNYDADVLIPPHQLLEAAYQIRNGQDMVYPYDGRFARVPRTYEKELSNSLDTFCLAKGEPFVGCRGSDLRSVGGAIFFNKESFVYGGMENENMISYGPEDVERKERFERLGYKVNRVRGQLYHIDHEITKNSSGQHPWFQHNYAELEKEQRMTPERLEKYVGTWPWVNKYLPSYYTTITEGAIRSRDEIFKTYRLLSYFCDDVVLDLGCGVGEMGSGFDRPYYGIDYRIPKYKLLIPKEYYADFDMRGDKSLFPFQTTPFSLVLCLEVMEHIEEQYADEIIDWMCTLAPNILFSAAIPAQGGLEHKNEQWADYWAQKFDRNGYGADLTATPYIRENEKIDIWYRQNIYLYIKGKPYTPLPKYVHPEMYTNIVGTLTNWKNIKPYEKAPN